VLWFWSDWDPLGAAESGAALGVFFLPLERLRLDWWGRITQNGVKASCTAPWSPLMAQQTITFSANALVKNLDLFAEVQLPYAASLALNRSLTPIVRAQQDEMRSKFRAPVPFTLNSIRTKASTKQNLTAQVWISYDGPKGNAPEDYLKPTIVGGQVYVTRFNKRLSRNGIMPSGSYMIPINDSPAASLGPNGRIRASQYVQALYGIQAMNDIIARDSYMWQQKGRKRMPYKTAGSYLYVPYVNGDLALEKKYRALGRGRIPAPGIYKVGRGDTLTEVFRQLSGPPSVQKRFDFIGSVQVAAQKEFTAAFNQTFKDVIGRENI